MLNYTTIILLYFGYHDKPLTRRSYAAAWDRVAAVILCCSKNVHHRIFELSVCYARL